MNNMNIHQIFIIFLVSFFLLYILSSSIFSIQYIASNLPSSEINMILKSIGVSMKISAIFVSIYTLIMVFLPMLVLIKFNFKPHSLILILTILFALSSIQSIIYPCSGIGTDIMNCKESIRSNYTLYDIFGISLTSFIFYRFLKWYLKPKAEITE